VSKAEVELPDKALVKFDPTKTNHKALIDAVKKAGYTAKVRKDEKEKKT
jgi:copper chaperone CopZ